MYIFKQAKDSILNFEKYPELIKTNFLKVFIYALVFIMLSNFIYFISPAIKDYFAVGGYDNFINEYIPDFKVEDNKLIIEEYSKKELPSGDILIFTPNDSPEELKITKEDSENLTNIIMKITPTHFITNALDMPIDINFFLQGLGIKTKNDLFSIKQIFISIVLFSFLFISFIYIIFNFLFLLLAAIWINFLSVFYKIKLPFAELFKLTIYVNTGAFLLKMFLSIFSVPVPSIVYIGIIIAYLHFIFKNFVYEKLYIIEEKKLSV